MRRGKLNGRCGALRAVSGGLSVLMLLTLAGCAVGPNYQEPAINAPEKWLDAQGEAKKATDATNAALTTWWKQLSDAQLDKVMDLALRGNLDLKLAEARVKQVRALRQGAASGLLPTIDATSGYQRREDSPNVGAGLGNAGGFGRSGDAYNSWSAGFESSWELDFFGRVRRGVEGAEGDLQSAEFEARDVLVALTGEVARNYAELRTNQQRLEITLGNLKTQEETLALSTSRFDAGLTSELDVVRARANVETTRSAIPSLQSAVRASIHRLGLLTGQAPGALIAELSVAGRIPEPSGAVDAGVPSELLKRRPDLRSIERQLAAQTARIGVATADLYPRITLGGSVGWNASKIATLFDASSVTYGIGPSVSWNIFDYGRIRSNIAAQGAAAEQILVRYERAVLSAFVEVENALVSYTNEKVRRTSLRDAVAAGLRSVELSTELYKQGLTDFNAVLDAQRQLFLLQDTLMQSEGTVAANFITLNTALGGGWDPRGDLRSAVIQPTAKENSAGGSTWQPAGAVPGNKSEPTAK
jgi:NodT family efflux transporter outer membrane factor (OMF) lipoprotein